MRFSRPVITPPANASVLFTNRTIVLRNDPPPILNARDIRAPKDPFNEFVENMKLLARIYNGITLVNGLIDGKIPPEAAIGELLRMGSLTPDVLKSLKASGGQKVLATIDELSTTKFGNSPELTKAKDDLINIFAAYRSQAIFTAVANVGKEKSEYETALNGFKNHKTVKLNDISALGSHITPLLIHLKQNIDNLKSDTDLSKATDDTLIFDLILPAFKILEQRLQNFGAVKDFSKELKTLEKKSTFLQTLVKESEMRLKIMTSKVAQDDKDRIVDDAKAFAKISENSQANQNVYGQMKSFVATQKFKSHQNRKYTAGFPDGTNDLNLLATNTADSWLQMRINGNQKTAQDLKKGLSSLDGVKTHMETAEDSWKPVASKIDAADSILSLKSEVAKLGIKETEVGPEVEALLTCQQDHMPNPIKKGTYDVVKGHIETLNTKLNELSDFEYLNGFTEIQTLKDAVDLNGSKDAAVIKKKVVALKAMKDKEVKSAIVKLNQFEADVKALEEIMGTLIGKILGDLSTIDTHLTNLNNTKFKDLTECVKNKVGDYGENIVNMFESIRNIEAAAKDTPNAKAYWTTVFASSDLMDKAVASAAAMKNVADRETKALAQMKNPTGSQDFGLAVQGLVTVQKLDKSQTKLEALTGDVQDILDAADDHKASLSTEHYDTLKTLRQLSTNLNTMFGEIKTVKGSVGKVGGTNLEVNKTGFEAAAKIKPVIVGDVKKMKAAIQSLKSQQGLDQAVANKLAEVETSLDVLAPLDLNFAKYKFSSAGAALKELDLFFVHITQALATTLPPPTSPAPTPSGGGGGGRNALPAPASSMALVPTTEAPGGFPWMYVGIGGGVFVVGGLIILVVWLCMKNRKLEETIEDQEKRLNESVEKCKAAETEAKNIAAKSHEDVAQLQADLQKSNNLTQQERREKEEQLAQKQKEKEEADANVVKAAEDRRQAEWAALLPKLYHGFDELITILETVSRDKCDRPIQYATDKLLAFKTINDGDRGSLNMDRYPNKHRYKIHCLESTSPQLPPLPNTTGKPFIHANVLMINDTQWIMSQGPLDGTEPHKPGKQEKPGKRTKDSTIETHWWMVEHMDVGVIIQLCNFVEDGSKKCGKYYPERVGETVTHGMYTLKALEKEENMGQFTYDKKNFSKVKVEYSRAGGAKKTVDILRYYGWPDQKSPERFDTALEILDFADSYHKSVIVHCSAGIGRTGTLVGIRKGIEMCLSGSRPGVNAILAAIRDCRINAIQTEEQMFFMLVTIVHALIMKDKEQAFVACYPALCYYYNQVKENKFDSTRPLKREKNGQPKKDKNGKFTYADKDEVYEFVYPEDALADIEAQHNYVEEARKAFEAKRGHTKSKMKSIVKSLKSRKNKK